MSVVTATGGTCPARITVDAFPGQPARLLSRPHESTARDIDASRYAGVYICDHCHGLFTGSRTRP